MKRLLLAAAVGVVLLLAPDSALTQARAVRVGPCSLFGGSGDPEGSQVASICDMFLADDGTAGTTLFVKESGSATNTGWVAVTDLTAQTGILASANGGTGVDNGGRTLTVNTTSGIFVFSGAHTFTINASLTATGSTGTPANDELAVWTDANTIEGEPNITYDGTTLGVVGTTRQEGANGQAADNVDASALESGLSGASVTFTNLIPAGRFYTGVTCRVTTNVEGATTFDIGDGSDVDRWGAAIILPAGTTTDITDFTADGFGQAAAAISVVLTVNGADFSAGAVRCAAHTINLVPPTS